MGLGGKTQKRQEAEEGQTENKELLLFLNRNARGIQEKGTTTHLVHWKEVGEGGGRGYVPCG